MKISMIAAMAYGAKIDTQAVLSSATGVSRVIGQNNTMPWHLPADFAWFKEHTLAKPIVMGRKTYESIGRPLPGRKNIIVSRDPNLIIDGVVTVTSLDAAFAECQDVEEVMVIGGGSIYAACLEKADRLYLTFIEADIQGDTYFPDWGEQWQCVEERSYAYDEKNQYDMKFVILERK